MKQYTEAFSQSKWKFDNQPDSFNFISITTLADLKEYLDFVHIRETLLKPFFENKNYPLIDMRSLLPSFESDSYEYHNLPGFSMLVLDRELSSFQEVFQYDSLHPISEFLSFSKGPCCPLESYVTQKNNHTMLARMPRNLHDEFKKRFQRQDITVLELYPYLLPYLIEMDRAHVISKSFYGHYQLSGIFASFPSDMNGEIKRFGLRIGKFQMGNDQLYQRNRNFVMQYLMELYGFPIASERRTSAALFSRRLHKTGENFLIRVLGQSDRVITTIWNNHQHIRYPAVDKITLVSIDKEQTDLINEIKEQNAFVDEKRRVVILRVHYKQHAFNKGNIRQDRALSIMSHEIIHPLTGNAITNINVLRDTTNLIIRLNDIIRGEYYGTVLYKKTELIENTDTEEKRLKFLFTWLSKHQRRIIGYSDEFFLDLSKIIEAYFAKLHEEDTLDLHEFIQENLNKFSFIVQARKVRVLEEIRSRKYKDKQLSYEQMLVEAVAIAKEQRFESIHYFDTIAESTLYEINKILNNRYLLKHYIEKPDSQLTAKGLEIKKNYSKLITVKDEIAGIQKSHTKDTLYNGF